MPVILSWLASLIGGPIVSGFIKAYSAKLQAENTSEKIAADLATRELVVEQREDELRTKLLIAEQGRWWTALPRPIGAMIVLIYIGKCIVWDKVFGLGVTDQLSPELYSICTTIIGAYFGGRTIEKVAAILKR
jgi:hypothetical protein